MGKGKLIGVGNTAEVFAWGEKEILKLFRTEFFAEGIDREYRISKEVEKLGLPVPRVGEMIEVEDRKGIIYERIFGVSMLKQIMSRPWTARTYGKQVAAIHYQIHQCKIQGLPKQKETFEWNIRHTELLAEDTKQKILILLSKLPEGEVLCHGDFHPGNIIVDANKEVILDWMTGTVGNPAADVARTILLLKDAALPEGTPRIIKGISKILRNRLTSAYLKRYLQLSRLPLEEINQWRIPIAAARLMEWVPESEKRYLLGIIKEAIK
ncbi:MAG: phosphotransferase family protein [Mobilitalea sp.]